MKCFGPKIIRKTNSINFIGISYRQFRLSIWLGQNDWGKMTDLHKFSKKPQSRVLDSSQSATTCSKLTIEALEEGAKYVQS